MPNSSFRSSMDFYKDKYFEKVRGDEWTPKKRPDSSEKYDALIQRIIKELYSFVVRVESFEETYGKNASEYIRKHTSDTSVPFSMERKPDKSRKDIQDLKDEWINQNNRMGYSGLSSIDDFIHKVEEIINQIKSTNNKSYVISDALDVLSSRQTGLAAIDKEHRNLAKSFKDSIQKEKERLANKVAKEIENKIKKLRESVFYLWKTRHNTAGWLPVPGRLLSTPDNQLINDNGNMTFKDIFEGLDSLSRSIDFKEEHYKGGDNVSLQGTLQTKINDFEKNVEKLSGYTENIATELHNYEVYLTPAEKAQVDDIKKQVGVGTLELKAEYADIVKKCEKYRKVLISIEAAMEREDAINEALSVLRSNPENVFPETIEILEREKQKCAALLQKHVSTVSLFQGMFSKLEGKCNEIENKMSMFHGIILEAQKRKNEEDRIRLNEDEKTMNLARVHEIERIQPEIDRIKMEVIRGMALEGYEPLSYDTGDFEHPGHDYQAYNEVFYQRLKEELDRRGINYEGADLSNPYDTETFQKMIEEGTKQAEANQMPVLKDMGNHSYVITSEDYRSIFNLMKAQLDQTGRNYSYDDIEELAKQYIDRIYGLDNIRNQSEFEDIVLKQMREFNNEKSSEK